MRSQQQVVFGAGLIGGYLGGALQMAGLPVALVCRPAIKARLSKGIKLTDYQGHQSGPIALNFVEDAGQLSQDVAVLWLTVKCTAVKSALADMAAFVSANTLILCCQNGLGSDALVKQAFPENRVLRVMVPFNVVELSAGHYHRGSQGEMSIELAPGQEADIAKLVNTINCDLLPLRACADMNALLWAKWQLNLGNSINALADIPVKAMLEQRGYRLVIAKLMRELLQVTDALAIKLPKVAALPPHWIPRVLSLPDFWFKRLANKMLAIDPNVRTSMWWDVSQGKRTEIDYLNGAVLAQARALGLRCPANEKVIALINSISLTPGAARHGLSAQELLDEVK